MDPVAAVEAFLQRPARGLRPKKLLVAVSGGADSVALLRAAVLARASTGWAVEALHCDHGLRGRASSQDAAWVQSLCARLGVPCATLRARLKPGPGLEERARQWRRACYARAAKARGAGLLLLGHHARDQAETVLLNLARGSGPLGASGMGALSPLKPGPGPRLGRPFLALAPESLRRWLKTLGQPWREDASNRDLAFARNRVRRKVLPELEKLNPRAVEHLAAFAAGLQRRGAKRPDGLAGLLRLDRAARGRASLALERGQGKADLGRGWSLEVSAGRTRVQGPPPALELALGTQNWGAWVFTLKREAPSARKVREPGAYWFSPDLLGRGARLRALGPGDRLKPFGFTGRRKAADLLREAGVPLWERAVWPGLEAEGRLVALPGVRRGEGFEARAGRPALRLGWKRGVDKALSP